MWWLSCLLLSCAPSAGSAPDAGSSSPPSPSADAGRVDAGRADAGRADAGRAADAALHPAPDAGAAQDLVEVAHEREIRGVWIATVWNINWPSRAGLSPAAQQAELDGLLDVAVDAGMNAVFLQVRAEADAFYRSDLEPFSRFLTGTQGADPGYDPLAYAIDAAHARGLELHAWMNPYRALATADGSVAAATHLSRSQPELVVAYGNHHWIDPGLEAAREHTLAVIRDVLERYDVDGLHFDDYFYPYPDPDLSFDDAATYEAYRGAGGTLSLGDWRRDNVHRMVAAVHDLVREVRPDVRFGISPFGIYRPGMPEGITGLDAYDAIYADPLRWLSEGWVDYLAPQLYWPTTQTAQAYGRLLDWWADRALAADRDLLVGHYLAKLGSAPEWSVDEIGAQLRLAREARDRRARGNIQYHVGPLLEDRLGVRQLFRDHHATPAASPALPSAVGRPDPPELTVDGATITASGASRYYAVYRDGVLSRLAPAAASTFALDRGSYVVSAIDREGRESLGVPIVVDADAPPPEPPEPTGASCEHSYGGIYADRGCSPSYQCCDGSWVARDTGCGACSCEEATGSVGCSP